MRSISALRHFATALAMAALTSRAADAPKPDQTPARIGVYDSRAVAVAWVGSPAFNARLTPLHQEAAKAKAAGDTKRLAELNAEGEAWQQRLHMQGFSTAPVDDILETLRDQLPTIRKEAGVEALVSKWDKETLAKHPDAIQKDVTMALVDALEPNDRQRLRAIEVQKHEPIPLEQARDLKD